MQAAGSAVLKVALVAALAVGLGLFVAESSRGAAPTELTGADYAEIERLYGLYNQGADFRDAEMWLSAFAEDAVFRTGPGQEQRGMAELRAGREARNQGQTGDNGRRHLNSSFVITATEDGAKGRAYWVLNDVTGPEPRTVASGYYDDTFVKTADGWKIRTRTLHRDFVAE
ncbi:MAG: nuclear transport factor 2 family protein [Acidobacteria bacterium]|nr:nuclear transport factor 2 family protein [Acidobacteriota bacterium]